MKHVILDIVTSVLQVFLFVIAINSSINYGENKISKMHSFSTAILLFIATVSFTNIFGNLSICVFIAHIASLLIVLICYKKNRRQAVLAYTTIYLVFAIYSIFFGNLFLGCIRQFIPEKYVFLLQVSIMYIPEYILIIVLAIYRDKIAAVNRILMGRKLNVKALVIISFILDFVIAFYMNIYGVEIAILKNIIIILCSVFFVGITVYFNNVENKSQQILALNNELEVKNNELSKVKHDYGAQISYLYGLHLMNRYEELAKALKNIIEKNGAISSGVEVADNKESLFSLALKPAREQGIHVIIDENSKTDLSHIDQIDLYRIVSNIISNAIKAMDGQGIIVTETYDTLKHTIIKIENNGPKIPEKDLYNIFNQGFTTKDNKDRSHGFGLSIVKELVEKYNGRITVKSTEASTEFKVIFPMKLV